MNNHTEAAVLAHHALPATADDAREAGLVALCLGCGTVTCVTAQPTTAETEAQRAWARENLDLDCCPDADTILY